MRIVVTAVTAALVASFAPAQAAVVDVLSGDVIRVDEKVWHIANIDAPQIEHACAEEAKLGLLAQAKLAAFVGQGEMEIRPTGKFDLNQRPRAFVRINGADVGEAMIAAHLVLPYGAPRPICLASIPPPGPVQNANANRPTPRGSAIQQGIERSRGSTSLPSRVGAPPGGRR